MSIYEHDNTTSKSLKARKVFSFQHFSFYEQLKFHSQLSYITFVPDLGLHFLSVGIYRVNMVL